MYPAVHRLTARLPFANAIRSNAAMPIASFHALCSGLRAGLGEPAGHPRADAPGPDAGLPPLHLAIADVEVTLTAKPQSGGRPGALVEVDFGQPPPEREESLLQTLMDANLRMMGDEAPAFARNPQGRIRLLVHWSLDRMELTEAQELLMMLAAQALDWRREAARHTGSPPGGFA